MKKINRDAKTAKYEMIMDSRPRQHSGIHKSNLLESPQYILGTLETQQYSGWIVQNWQRGWLWLSNWVFALIAWVAIYGIPPEMVALIPEASRETVIPALSALGMFCRFIDQNRKKPLPIWETEDK